MKTYERGELAPDTWVALYKRRGTVPIRYVFSIKMPWKARIYTINNDAYQLRNPRLTFSWYVYHDPFWHQCTKEELAAQEEYYR